MKRRLLAVALLLSIAVTSAFAQEGPRIPEASSPQTITQGLGLSTITLTYARPNVKGRKVFGGLEPYGAVWRTGANNATTIKFNEDILIEGKNVAAGEYGLFTIPGQTEWTIILNKTAKQWGAYEYKEADDVLRVKVKPVKSPVKMETFGMQFINVTPKTAELWLAWENVLVPVKLTIDDDAKITANIDQIMSGTKKNYFGAIQYYHDNKTAKADLEKALAWADEAQQKDPKAPYYILWKARLLLKLGRKREALTAANAGIKLATELKNDEYIRLNQEVANKTKS
jgi:hypothetical protein